MLTTRPNFAAFIPSNVSLHRLKQPPRLVSITSSHIVRVIRASVPSRVMPALLTSTSIGPSSRVICCTAASQAA